MTYLIIDELRLQNKNIDELNTLAEGGNVAAQYELGIMFLHKNKEQRSFHKAIRWLEEAALNGDVGAKEALASMYHLGPELGPDMNGSFVDIDLNRAVKWYKEAAEAGSILPKARLAILAEQGVISDPDLVKRYKNDVALHITTHPKRKSILLGFLVTIGFIAFVVVMLVRMFMWILS